MALAQRLTPQIILQLAGERSYERGADYFREDLVRLLDDAEDRITATVRGTRPYRVALWDDDGLRFACDCPVGLGGTFCKHCVAVALAWMAEETESSGAEGAEPAGASAGKARLNRRDLRDWLVLQDVEVLADLILEAAEGDAHLHNRLLLRAAAAKGANLATFRKVLNQAIGTRGFVDYREMPDYWRGADSAIDTLDDLLREGRADAVIELSEYALARVEESIENVDDSDGYMGGLLDRLQGLHLAACRAAPPDPEVLASRLFAWELNGEWDTFSAAATTYADVLRDRGMRRYRELAEAEWAKVKPLALGDKDPHYYGPRFRISRIMETLADRDGDIDALVAIRARDLSSSYQFLRIAEILRDAQREDQALAWAEKGMQAFGAETDVRLRDLLADLYHNRGRHDEALALIWPQFDQRPSLDGYIKLKAHADRCASWPEWRERALSRVRQLIAETAASPAHRNFGYGTRPGDRSLMVEIFLWEKDAEAAWREASEGGCHEGLWHELARLREKDQPDDAIAVYRRLIGPIVERTNNDAYAKAYELIRRIAELMARLGLEADFRAYLAEVRNEYKRKRNFMKLLDRIEERTAETVARSQVLRNQGGRRA